MAPFLKTIVAMGIGLFGITCAGQVPQGKLTYCSYSKTGAAGLGKDYCELLADPGETPRVVVALKVGNRFRDPEIHAEYPVSPSVVDSLQTLLDSRKVYELDGYNVEESITGGYSYRIYQEYDSGQKVNARWYGHNIKAEALSAYRMIEQFFAPWREQAIREGRLPVRCRILVQRSKGAGTDHYLLMAHPGAVPAVVIDLNVDNRIGKKEVHKQFDIDDESVEKLRAELLRLKVGSLEGYKQENMPKGGTGYTVELEYSPDDKKEFCWKNKGATPEVQAVYDALLAFFREASRRP